jgi:hypothetical protein
MNRPTRILSVFTGTAGLAALTLSLTLWAQAIDNRPIYYVMLKSLEDAFQDYNIALTEDLNRRASSLKTQYEADRLVITNEFEMLEAARTRKEAEFNSEREILNQRIAAVNEQITLRDGRINEERRIRQHHSPRFAKDPRIKVLKERVAAELAEIDTIRTTYRAQSAATQEARAALTRQIREYVSAGDPLALEIRSLEEDWRRFAENERRKLKQVADAYAVDYAAYDKWLTGESAVFEEMRAALVSARNFDREQRALHAETETALRGLIDEYNELVEVHNKADADDPSRDDRARRFADLEDQIAELQATLSRARDAVVNVDLELRQKNQELTERYERFASEKQARDTTLAADLAEINSAQLAVEAIIDGRREKMDAQIRTLETHISAELHDARNALEVLNTRLIDSFGRDHEGFDVAITRVLESNDGGLLYTAGGTPRFDLSRPLTARVYTAVDRLETDRSEIDARIVVIEESEGGARQGAAGQPAGAVLEREQATLSAERQQLLEAYAASARTIQAKSAALEQRRLAADVRFADERAALGELYSARASLTRSEMQSVQGVLVAAVKGIPDAISTSGEHARLRNALNEKAARTTAPVDKSLLAPHALMDGIARERADASSDGLSGAWEPFASRKISGSRELTGADKAALALAWFAQLVRQPRFAEISQELGASGAVGDARRALASLFMAGIVDHTTITEQRLNEGGIGIQVSVLGRDYQLDPGGSLEPLPKR